MLSNKLSSSDEQIVPDICQSYPLIRGGGGNLGVILVRVCEPLFFKPTPIIYFVFEKIMTYSYT